MPKISLKKSRRDANGAEFQTFDVAPGTNLMRALLDAGLPVASSCRGDGVCAKCRVRVLAGNETLNRESDLERYLRERHSFEKSERVSCQVEVGGDLTIDTDYW